MMQSLEPKIRNERNTNMGKTLEPWQIEVIKAIPGVVPPADMTPAEEEAWWNASDEERLKMLDAFDPDWRTNWKAKTPKVEKLTPAQLKEFYKLDTAEARQKMLDAIPD